MTWPDTLADLPAAQVAEHVLHDGEDEVRRTSTVEAPCCGRRCAADMVTDVRDVPGIDRDWMCDGCEWSYLRDASKEWNKSRFVRALGAPVRTVREHWVRERVERARRRASEMDNRIFVAEEARQRAIRHLPPEGELPPGTEPPGEGQPS